MSMTFTEIAVKKLDARQVLNSNNDTSCGGAYWDDSDFGPKEIAGVKENLANYNQDLDKNEDLFFGTRA